MAVSPSLLSEKHDSAPQVAQIDANVPLPVAVDTSDEVPEGGYGWICVFAVGTINCFIWGVAASYGVYLAYYLANDTFAGSSAFDYAMIGGLVFAIAVLIAPVVTILALKYGTHPTMLFGVAVHASGFIAASFVGSIAGLYLTQGMMVGIGTGFMFIPSVAILPQWFHKRRTLAQGFSSAGSGVGGIAFSLGTHAMIDGISLAWSLRITGIICFTANLCATLLLRDRNATVKPMQAVFPAYLLKRPEVILLLMYSVFNMLGYMIVLYSLSNYAISIGLTQSQSSIITALLNLGTAIGRPTIGFASDRLGRLLVAGLLAFFTSVCCFAIWIPATSYGVLIFFALIAGSTIGTFWMTIAPLAAEVAGLREVPALLTLTWLSIVLPCAFAEVIGLYLRQDDGRPYLYSQIFAGLTYGISSLFLAALWWKKRKA